MKRTPIITEPKNIVMVQAKPTIHDLIPDYQYQFQNETPSEESAHMYSELLDFLSTNEELALMGITDKTEYGKGFSRAIAMVKLWIDSIYLDRRSNNGAEHRDNQEGTNNLSAGK